MNLYTFDHFAVSCTDLEAGHHWVRDALETPLSDVGYHPYMSTHNRLMSLGGEEYLEVIAIDPEAPDPGRPRWFGLDDFTGRPRLTNWIIRCHDLEAGLRQLPYDARIIELERGPYQWRVALPEGGQLPMDGAHPMLLQWLSPHPAPHLAATDVRLQRLTVRHPEMAALAERLDMADPRIVLETGPLEITAVLDTPNGPRTLA